MNKEFALVALRKDGRAREVYHPRFYGSLRSAVTLACERARKLNSRIAVLVIGTPFASSKRVAIVFPDCTVATVNRMYKAGKRL